MGALIKNDRIRGEVWHECAVCGLEYPESQMWFRRGSFVCFENDADENLLVESEPFDSSRIPDEVERPDWPRK